MWYYDPAFYNLALGRATIERHNLNLSTKGLYQGSERIGNGLMALREPSRRRRHHALATVSPNEAQFMNATIADYPALMEQAAVLVCTGTDGMAMSREISAPYFVRLPQPSHPVASSPPWVNGTAARKFLT
jgi:hypothetical protein